MKKVLFAILMLSLACGMAFAKCPPEPKPDKFLYQALNKAYELQEKKDLKGALARLKRYQANRPDVKHPRLYYMLGMLSYQLDDLTGAKEQLSRSLEQYSCFPAGWRNLAIVHYQLKEYKQAADCAWKAYEIDRDPAMKFQAAMFRYYGKEYNASLKLLRELAKEAKPKQEWLKALANVLMIKKKWSEARKVIKWLIRMSPAEASLWRLQAGLEVRVRKYAKAAAALEVAYRLEKPDKQACRQLSELHRAAGAGRRAAFWYEKYLADAPKPKQLDTLARIYWQASQPEQALKAAKRAFDAKPSPKRKLDCARMLMQFHRYDAAYDAFLKAAEMGAKPDECYLMAGQCAWFSGDFKKARRAYNLAAKHCVAKEKKEQAVAALEAIQAYEDVLAN